MVGQTWKGFSPLWWRCTSTPRIAEKIAESTRPELVWRCWASNRHWPGCSRWHWVCSGSVDARDGEVFRASGWATHDMQAAQGREWESSAGRRPSKHMSYIAALVSVWRKVRLRLQGGRGTTAGGGSTASLISRLPTLAYLGLPWELQENLCLLPYPPWPLLKKLNIVLTLKVCYLKEFHYWREYIEGWLQSWGSKLIIDTIYGFKEENDVKFPNDQELIASLK